MKEWLKKAGYKPNNYTLHGPWRGGATHAYNRCIPEHAIHLMGDWRSDTYKAYLEEDLSKCIATASDIAMIGCV